MAFLALMGIIAFLTILAIVWMEYDSRHLSQMK